MKYDLEERLISFAVSILKLIETLPDRKACNHLANQLIRSGTSPALIYGEANAAESRTDFIHKMGIGLKELRETNICLRIIDIAGDFPDQQMAKAVMDENRQLIAIFGGSINTAKKKLRS